MKKQTIAILCIVVCGTLFGSVYGMTWLPADNIPPTNAFDKIHSDNGTIDAVNFSMPLNIKSGSGISIKSNNSTHTLTISNSALSTIQGTYNTTQANNANINVGGNKLNFINGTGCIVNVKDSHSSTQANVTISCTGSGGTITSINSEVGPAIVIHGSTGNITVTNTTNTLQINTGSDIPHLSKFNNFTKGMSIPTNEKYCYDGTACTMFGVGGTGILAFFVNNAEQLRINGNIQLKSPELIIPVGETTSRTSGVPEISYNIQSTGEQDQIGGNGFSKIINFYAKGGAGPPYAIYLKGFIGNQTSFTAANFTSDAGALASLPNHMCEDYFVTGNSTFRHICNFNGIVHVLAKG